MFCCFTIVVWLILYGDFDSVVGTSPLKMYDTKILSSDDQSVSDIAIGSGNPPLFELVLNLRNLTEDEIVESHFEKRSRNSRRKKEKQGKLMKLKNKTTKSGEFDMGRIHRNDEKDLLVRNRTIEILKSGFKILSAKDEHSFGENKTLNHLNETLLEKILSSGASKPDILISGIYKLPIGGNIYGHKEIFRNKTASENVKYNFRGGKNVSQENVDVFDNGRNKTSHDQTFDYEDDYDDVKDSNNRDDIIKPNAFNYDYKGQGFDSNVRDVMGKIIATLRSLDDVNDGASCEDGRSHFTDPCTKWLECKIHLEKAFMGQNVLPSCPCHYPSTIFYNDAIWDQNQKRFSRWRDASNEAERLDIYKPGAVYCIRSLLAQSGASISSQQCCYDGQLRLLTRGSGAGTVNFVSPDVSKELHDIVDILPWRLCKGDFTRYNLARRPDNGNRCPTNPKDELYQLQVKLSKYF